MPSGDDADFAEYPCGPARAIIVGGERAGRNSWKRWFFPGRNPCTCWLLAPTI